MQKNVFFFLKIEFEKYFYCILFICVHVCVLCIVSVYVCHDMLAGQRTACRT